LTTFNIAKIEKRQAQPDGQPMVYSMASVKACYSNELFLQLVFHLRLVWELTQKIAAIPTAKG